MITRPSRAAGPVQAQALAKAGFLLLADRSIQFDLESYEPAPTPDWLKWLADFLSTDHPVLRSLLWVLAGAALLFILYLIARRLAGDRWPWRGKGEAGGGGSGGPGGGPARALLGEADALAARGDYSEAAHLLLFRSIEDIDSRRPDLVRPALTSRDIAALAAIPVRPRAAFARIAEAVERALFARRPLGADDWRDCRSGYEEFAFAAARRG